MASDRVISSEDTLELYFDPETFRLEIWHCKPDDYEIVASRSIDEVLLDSLDRLDDGELEALDGAWRKLRSLPDRFEVRRLEELGYIDGEAEHLARLRSYYAYYARKLIRFTSGSMPIMSTARPHKASNDK